VFHGAKANVQTWSARGLGMRFNLFGEFMMNWHNSCGAVVAAGDPADEESGFVKIIANTIPAGPQVHSRQWRRENDEAEDRR